MTTSPQSKQGWFQRQRERRRAIRQERLERRYFAYEQAGEPGASGHRLRAYRHDGSAPFFGAFGGDGGGCGGDGGGGC